MWSSGAQANAWCAVCRSEYELPPDTDALKTHCGACAAWLIPHHPDRVHLPRTRMLRGTCPHCSAQVTRPAGTRHVRCPSCATAITPVFADELFDGDPYEDGLDEDGLDDGLDDGLERDERSADADDGGFATYYFYPELGAYFPFPDEEE